MGFVAKGAQNGEMGLDVPDSAATLPEMNWRPSVRKPGVSAVGHVYEDLRNLIINLKFAPGSPFAKNVLAERFNVSPTPVREALLRLAEEDLVNIIPQSGTAVSLINIQSAQEVHFLRLSVEIEVARVLCKEIDDSGLAELNAWMERQVTELNAGNQTAFKHADNSFHLEMFQLAGVKGLTQLLDRRRGHYDRIRGLYLREHQRREIVVEEHREIFAALQKRDTQAAEAAVRMHLGKSLAIVDQIRDRYPNYFLSSE